MANPGNSMPRGKLKNLEINELSGVDKPCQQPATVALMKRAPKVVKALFERVLKQAVTTNEVAGHAHSIDLDDPACEWRDQYSTSCQTAEGAAQPHSHAWTYDPATGAVTIAADSGHTHTVIATVPRDVLASAVLNEAAEKQRRAKQNAAAAALAVETGTVAVAIVPVEMRAAPAAISTPTPAVSTVSGNSQESPPMPMDPVFAKMLATALQLPEAQRGLVTKLAPAEQEAFLGMPVEQRESVVNAAEAADPEVYKTTAGLSIRKSHGPLAEQLARQGDELAKAQAATVEQLAKANAATAQAAIEKRAGELIPLIGKSLAVRVEIVKGANAITDEALRNDVIEAWKGANEAMRLLGVPQGGNPGTDEPGENTAQKRLELKVTEYAKANNLSYPEALIRASGSDPEIRKLYNEAQVAGS